MHPEMHSALAGTAGILCLAMAIIFTLVFCFDNNDPDKTTSALKHSNTLLKSKLSALQSKLDHSASQILELNETLATANMKANTELEYKERLERQVKRVVDRLTKEVRELRGRSNALEHSLQEKKQILENVALENDALTCSVLLLSTQADALRAANKKLKAEVDAKDADCWILHDQVKFKGKELADMTARLEDRNSLIAHLDDELCEKDGRIARLEELMEYVQRESEHAREEIVTWRGNVAGTVRALAGRIEELRRRVEGLEERMGEWGSDGSFVKV